MTVQVNEGQDSIFHMPYFSFLENILCLWNECPGSIYQHDQRRCISALDLVVNYFNMCKFMYEIYAIESEIGNLFFTSFLFQNWTVIFLSIPILNRNFKSYEVFGKITKLCKIWIDHKMTI